MIRNTYLTIIGLEIRRTVATSSQDLCTVTIIYFLQWHFVTLLMVQHSLTLISTFLPVCRIFTFRLLQEVSLIQFFKNPVWKYIYHVCQRTAVILNDKVLSFHFCRVLDSSLHWLGRAERARGNHWNLNEIKSHGLSELGEETWRPGCFNEVLSNIAKWRLRESAIQGRSFTYLMELHHMTELSICYINSWL